MEKCYGVGHFRVYKLGSWNIGRDGARNETGIIVDNTWKSNVVIVRRRDRTRSLLSSDMKHSML